MSRVGERFVTALFGTGARRSLGGWQRHVLTGLAAAVSVWVVYAAAFSHLDALTLAILFLAMMLVLTFLTIAPTTRAEGLSRVPWYDWALATASVGFGCYFGWHADTIMERIALLTPLGPTDVAVSTLVIVLTLEAMRRTVGMGLTGLVIGFVAYNLFGHLIDGPLGHGLITPAHFLDITVFTTDGLFGVPLRVAATYAFLFVLFGTLLGKVGGSDFFFQLAASVSGRQPGGPAKIAVVSSALYGTISGSPTSDVVTTGSITIPMMIRVGYKPRLAGAVEVAASTGGSLLPPVMGSAAFIMAEYTGIPYAEIAVAALIPALLYYFAIYMQVDLRSRRYSLRAVADDQIAPLWQTLKDGGLFLVPLAAITWALLDGYTPTFSALYGSLATLAVCMLRARSRIGPRGIVEVLAESARRMVAVTGACAAAGLVIGGITMTGLATKFSHLVFLLTESDVFLSLLTAGALTIVLGLGMPTPSAYILAAVLVGPLLDDLGVPAMGGHLFLLYFAVMSALTPPVAVAAYAAAAISNSNPLAIALMAVRMALAAFVLPFAFVYHSPLLMQGEWYEVALAATVATLAVLGLAAGIEGYLRRLLTPWERLLMVAGGLLALSFDPVAASIGVACCLLGLVLTYLIDAPPLARALIPEPDQGVPESTTRDPVALVADNPAAAPGRSVGA